MAITGRTDSLNGLKAFGATVKNLSGVALGSQSYRYADYFIALAAGSVTYPCTVAMQELEKQKGFTSQAFQGGSPVTRFNILHFLLHYEVAGTASYKTKEPDIVTMEDHYDQALAAFAVPSVSNPMGWALVNHGKVELIDPEPAVKFAFEGISYHASVYKYAITINL